MTRRRLSCATALALTLLAGACGANRRSAIHTPPAAAVAPEPLDTIVLLPDEDSATAGRLVVRGAAGEVALEHPWAATRVPVAGRPQVDAAPSDDVRDRVREVLAGLPAAPAQFTLHFNLESEKLTEESLARLSDVRAAATARPAVEVFVSGHTDRSGTADANVTLGLTRAASIRDLLISAGVPAPAIRITSHGEATPIVPTRDGTFEPRNRRVEITVR